MTILTQRKIFAFPRSLGSRYCLGYNLQEDPASPMNNGDQRVLPLPPMGCLRMLWLRSYLVARDVADCFPAISRTVRNLLWFFLAVFTIWLVAMGERWADRASGLVLMLLVVAFIAFWRWIVVVLPVFSLISAVFVFRCVRTKYRERPTSIGYVGDRIGLTVGNESIVPDGAGFRYRNLGLGMAVYSRKRLDPIVVVPASAIPMEWMKALKEQLGAANTDR